MAFTTVTITHQFQNADTTPASGTITFQLSKRMTNGTLTVVPAEVIATLNGSGQLSQALTANNDAGTVPGDAEWLVTFRIQGASQDGPFAITVPSGGGTVDLGSLLSQQPIGG